MNLKANLLAFSTLFPGLCKYISQQRCDPLWRLSGVPCVWLGLYFLHANQALTCLSSPNTLNFTLGLINFQHFRLINIFVVASHYSERFLRQSTYKDKSFTLEHTVRWPSPWLLGLVPFRPVVKQPIMTGAHGEAKFVIWEPESQWQEETSVPHYPLQGHVPHNLKISNYASSLSFHHLPIVLAGDQNFNT